MLKCTINHDGLQTSDGCLAHVGRGDCGSLVRKAVLSALSITDIKKLNRQVDIYTNLYTENSGTMYKSRILSIVQYLALTL